jgi:hypothetical protein
MNSSRALTIGLIVAILVVRLWFNGHLGTSWNALTGPLRPLGGA